MKTKNVYFKNLSGWGEKFGKHWSICSNIGHCLLGDSILRAFGNLEWNAAIVRLVTTINVELRTWLDCEHLWNEM